MFGLVVEVGYEPNKKEMEQEKKPGGRNKIQPDLSQLEELGGSGLKVGAIARLHKPPMDRRTLEARIQESEDVAEAIERGWAKKQKELLHSQEYHAKKSPISALFLLKQDHLGGFIDENSRRDSTEKIEIEIREGVVDHAWAERKRMMEQEKGEVIDITPRLPGLGKEEGSD